MKKQPDKLAVAAPLLLGILFAVLSGVGVITCAIQDPTIVFVPCIPFLVSLAIITVGIRLDLRRKHLESLSSKENISTCVVEEYTASGIRFTNYYVIVTYKGKSGTVYYQKIPCNLDDYNKFTKGTEIDCFLKDEDCYVPYSSISRKKYN